jgi:hypothetical protein
MIEGLRRQEMPAEVNTTGGIIVGTMALPHRVAPQRVSVLSPSRGGADQPTVDR